VRDLVVHNRYRSGEPSGENAVVEDESRFLAEAGCEVERLELESDAIADWPLIRRASLPGRVVWSREGGRLVAAAAAAFRPDVIHVHNTFPLFGPGVLWQARRSGAAVVATVHNFRPLCPAATFLREGRVCEDCLGRVPVPSVVHGCYRGSRLATVPLAVSAALHGRFGTWTSAAHRLVFPSDFARRKYLQAGWPGERLVVKANTAPEAGTPRSGSGGRFMAISRLAAEKGLDDLLDAYRIAFPDGGPGLELVGSGPEEASLRARLPEGVNLAGRLDRPEAMRRLRDARALVVPSRWYEVFPRVVVEAYSLGVPVVAARIGALAEIVEDGRTGLLAEPRSPAALAGALQTLADSDELSLDLGNGARTAYEERLSPERTTAQLLTIYDEARAQAAEDSRRAVAA
jgi:glycosyltransferase involved in cell wall biosynthesis